MRLHVKPANGEVQEVDLDTAFDMLTDGRLAPGDLAWHEGLADWVPVRDVEAMRKAGPPTLPLGTTTQANAPTAEPQAVDESKKFFGGIYHPWRRFFARFIDINIASFFIMGWIGFALAFLLGEGANDFILILSNPFVAGFVTYIFWIPLEALLISTLGATAGKWLFGIQVRSSAGRRLGYGASLKRAILVFVAGEGIGFPIATLITRLVGYFRLTKTGTTYWDKSAEAVVTHTPWGPIRTVFCPMVTIAMILMSIASIVIFGQL